MNSIERENEFIKNIFNLTVLQEQNSSDRIKNVLERGVRLSQNNR